MSGEKANLSVEWTVIIQNDSLRSTCSAFSITMSNIYSIKPHIACIDMAQE